MDYIILKSDGSLQTSSLNRYIQQGSTGVDKIFVGWAGALATDVVDVIFTLPNQTTKAEVYTQTYESDYNYDGEHTSKGWIITLYSAETTYNGLLFAALRVIRGGVVQVCYPFTLVINETGVRPDADSGVTIEELDSYLVNIETLVGNAVRDNTDSQLSNTSENPVQNKVVKQAIDDAIAGVYKVQGSANVSTLNGLTKSESLNGNVYNVLDSGTLTNSTDTISVQEGDNVVFVWNEGTWYWDRLAGLVDTSNLVTLSTDQEITGTKTIKDTSIDFYYTGATGDATWHIKEDNYGRLSISRTYNDIETTYWNFDGSSMIPNQTNTNVIGASNRYLKEIFVNKVHSGNLSFKVFDAPSGTLVFTDEMMTELMGGGITINGQLYGLNIYNPVLFKGTYTSTNDVWGIIVYSAQANGELQEIALYRIPQSTKQFSIATYNWVNYKNAKSVDFGNNAKIIKDNSNRVVIQYNGNDRVKIGNAETYFVCHVEPDSNNNFDLGRSGMNWRYVYCNYITNSSVIIDVGDIATKIDTTDTLDLGTFDSNGEITIAISDLEDALYNAHWGSELHGLYMLTYCYAQSIMYLDKTQIANASLIGSPIRSPMPVVYNALNSYAVPGNIRVQKVGTNYVFKVSDGNQNAAQGQHLYMINTNLIK